MEPERQLGTRAIQRPETIEGEKAGEINKDFAECVYKRSKAAADQLLASGDPLNTPSIEWGDEDDKGSQFTGHACLGNWASLRNMSLEISPWTFRAMMAEEAYLARFRQPAVLAANAQEATGRTLQGVDLRAVGMMELADCITFRDTPAADALLRTTPQSAAERDAAVALAPVVSACLLEGQSFRVTPQSIRALAADGLWARYARTVD